VYPAFFAAFLAWLALLMHSVPVLQGLQHAAWASAVAAAGVQAGAWAGAFQQLQEPLKPHGGGSALDYGALGCVTCECCCCCDCCCCYCYDCCGCCHEIAAVLFAARPTLSLLYLSQRTPSLPQHPARAF